MGVFSRATVLAVSLLGQNLIAIDYRLPSIAEYRESQSKYYRTLGSEFYPPTNEGYTKDTFQLKQIKNGKSGRDLDYYWLSLNMTLTAAVPGTVSVTRSSPRYGGFGREWDKVSATPAGNIETAGRMIEGMPNPKNKSFDFFYKICLMYGHRAKTVACKQGIQISALEKQLENGEVPVFELKNADSDESAEVTITRTR